MSFLCAKCAKTFSKKYNLVRHIERVHNRPPKSPKSRRRSAPEFICNTCNKSFSRKQHVAHHLLKVHGDHDNEHSQIICSYCMATGIINKFVTRKYLREHCTEKHNIQFNEETLLFSSMLEFKKWQLGIERSTFCEFISTRGVRNLANGVKKYHLYCHRDGKFRSRSKCLRRGKATNKIDAACTAQMIVSVDDQNNVTVDYISNHCNHDFNISPMLSTKEERASIAAKVKEGVPFDTILDEIRDSVNGLFTDNALVCLTKQDLRNIQLDFHLPTGCQHENDFISIKLWIQKVQDLDEKNPIIYFEEQSPDEDKNLAYDSDNGNMMLIIANNFQLSMLRKFGNNIVCIDSIYGSNVYDFHLTTLIVIDEFGCGIPTAFCISNKKNTTVWNTFFLKLRDHVGILETQVFMTDIDDSFYNVWKTVMKPVPKRLLCAWYIDHAWRAILQKKIRNIKKRAIAYKALRVLLRETNIDKFKILVENFLKDAYNNEHTRPFASYFDNFYTKCIHEWAYCFRKDTGINTNIYLESMHEIFKYYYLQGRKNQRLDTCIDALLRLIRDHYFRRLRELGMKNPLKNEDAVLQSHHEALSENVGEMTQISDRIWFVDSSTDANVTYEITKILDEEEDCFLNSTCFCTCASCQICIHTYSCECIDYVIKNNICKHIHFCVLQTRMKLNHYSDNLSKVYEDSIATYLSPVSLMPSNYIISSLKLKLKTLHGYLMNENLTDDDFTDEEKSFMTSLTRDLDQVMDIVTINRCPESNVTWLATD